ncbi:mitochondrial proton/calcium exchanger protein-like protein isoform X1 [Tanacetum coccineum]
MGGNRERGVVLKQYALTALLVAWGNETLSITPTFDGPKLYHTSLLLLSGTECISENCVRVERGFFYHHSDLLCESPRQYVMRTHIIAGMAGANRFSVDANQTLLHLLFPRIRTYCGPFQGGGYRATAPGYYQRNNANPSFQERRQSIEETLSKFMNESAKRHEENSNLIKEIRASTDAAIRNQGASIKTLEIQIGQMSKVLQERGFGSLPSSIETNPRDQVKSISTTIEADSNSIRRIRSTQYAVSTRQNRTLLYKPRQTTVPFPGRLEDHYCEEEGNYGPKFTEAYGASLFNNTIPRKEKDPGSFTLPCFINDFCFDNAIVDLGASVSVMPLSTYLNLGLGELAHTRLTVELADRTVKYPKGIAENVLVEIGKFTFLVDFIILDMPEDIKVP